MSWFFPAVSLFSGRADGARIHRVRSKKKRRNLPRRFTIYVALRRYTSARSIYVYGTRARNSWYNPAADVRRKGISSFGFKLHDVIYNAQTCVRVSCRRVPRERRSENFVNKIASIGLAVVERVNYPFIFHGGLESFSSEILLLPCDTLLV